MILRVSDTIKTCADDLSHHHTLTITKQFKIEQALVALKPRYNIALTQMSPIVVAEGKGRGLHMARWGLVLSQEV